MSEIVERMAQVRLDADVAFANGDYATARELYTRLMGLIESGAIEQEKDAHRFRLGDIERALREIETIERMRSGAGKIRRIPITTGVPDGIDDC